MNPPAGWYVDPTDQRAQVYWTGSEWDYEQVKPARFDTPRVPGTPAPTMSEMVFRPGPGNLAGWGTLAGLVAFLTALGALIGGIALMAYRPPSCSGLYGCGTEHPYIVTGAAVLIGGLLQAGVFWAVHKVCGAVAKLQADG